MRETDAVNGNGVERPALEYALAQLELGAASCLAVTELERLCRSAGELGALLAALERLGARLVCLQPEVDSDTELGRSALVALATGRRWELARRPERIRNGLAVAWKRDSTIGTAAKDRLELKQRILTLRAEGMTLQEIADVFNGEGVPTLRGASEWRPLSIHAAGGYKRPQRNGGSQPAGSRNGELVEDGISNPARRERPAESDATGPPERSAGNPVSRMSQPEAGQRVRCEMDAVMGQTA